MIPVVLLLTGILAAVPEVGPVSTATETSVQTLIQSLPNEEASKALHERLAKAPPAEASRLLMEIGLSGQHAARPLVVGLLAHKDPLVVERAVRALGLLGIRGPEQRATVTALLAHPSEGVRVQAIICLSKVEDLRLCPLFIERLRDQPPAVSEAALTALHRLTGHPEIGPDPLLWGDWYRDQLPRSEARFAAADERLHSTEVKEVIGAIESLALLQSESARVIELLEPMVRDEDVKVVFAARQVLSRLAPGDFPRPTAEEQAIALNPKSAPTPIAVGGLQRLLPGNGIFDTWIGLALAAIGACGALGATLFLLRTPTVRSVTKRFVNGVVSGTGRILKPAGRIITTSTGRIFRPITARMRKTTDRIAKKDKSAAKS